MEISYKYCNNILKITGASVDNTLNVHFSFHEHFGPTWLAHTEFTIFSVMFCMLTDVARQLEFIGTGRSRSCPHWSTRWWASQAFLPNCWCVTSNNIGKEQITFLCSRLICVFFDVYSVCITHSYSDNKRKTVDRRGRRLVIKSLLTYRPLFLPLPR